MAFQSIMTQSDPEKAESACTPPATVKPDDDQREVQSSHSARTMNSEEQAELNVEYPQGMKLALIMLSLYLAVFLVALVRIPNSDSV